MAVEINGIAHVALSVRRFAECRAFYSELLPFLGMTPVIDVDTYLYCVGGRTAVAITPCAAEHAEVPFDQTRAGLHHLCFRSRSRGDVDAVHAKAMELGASDVRAPEDGDWAPGYYSSLFEDPDGIRIEINHVPGKGLLTT